MPETGRRSPTLRHAAVVASVALFPALAHASLLSGDALDTMADWLALFVLFAVPIGAIVLFWMIHVLPEKIAEKRHHPQKDAIHVLCIMSLFFGGLLWPFAWLWAYTRPVGYKMAYGTDKHDDYFVEMADKARSGDVVDHDIAHLRDELDAMAARGQLPQRLATLRAELDTLAVPTLATAAPAHAPATRPDRTA